MESAVAEPLLVHCNVKDSLFVHLRTGGRKRVRSGHSCRGFKRSWVRIPL